MTRYYFHMADGYTRLDNVGKELLTLHAARQHAVKLSAEVLTKGINQESLWLGIHWRLWVTEGPDGSGGTLFTLRFAATPSSDE